ncbi:hypothetical protein ON010_g13646 [Phytophthora cinnamomi]|nr:hypothetical protein ON010_g13646 [Phytophthora cinnamomi]
MPLPRQAAAPRKQRYALEIPEQQSLPQRAAPAAAKPERESSGLQETLSWLEKQRHRRRRRQRGAQAACSLGPGRAQGRLVRAGLPAAGPAHHARHGARALLHRQGGAAQRLAAGHHRAGQVAAALRQPRAPRGDAQGVPAGGAHAHRGRRPQGHDALRRVRRGPGGGAREGARRAARPERGRAQDVRRAGEDPAGRSHGREAPDHADADRAGGVRGAQHALQPAHQRRGVRRDRGPPARLDAQQHEREGRARVPRAAQPGRAGQGRRRVDASVRVVFAPAGRVFHQLRQLALVLHMSSALVTCDAATMAP